MPLSTTALCFGSECRLSPIPRELSTSLLQSHIARMTEKRSKGKIDPSRWLAPVDCGSGVAGRDDPADLRDFAGADGWRSVSVGVLRRYGRPGCNSAVPDHNAGRSKTQHDIHSYSKSVGEEALHHQSSAKSRRLRL